MKQHLYEAGTTWIFNPPYASHMGGVWERTVLANSILVIPVKIKRPEEGDYILDVNEVNEIVLILKSIRGRKLSCNE